MLSDVVTMSPLPLCITSAVAFGAVHVILSTVTRWDVLLTTTAVGMLHLLIQLPSSAHAIAYEYDSRAIADVSFGFFLYDLVACIVHYRSLGRVFLVHAIASVTVFGTLSLGGGGFTWATPRLLMWELSTPFVYAKTIMDRKKHSRERHACLRDLWYIGNGLALMVTFFACRIVWTAIMYRHFFLNLHAFALGGSVVPALALLLVPGPVLGVLNVYWLSRMVRTALKVLFTGR